MCRWGYLGPLLSALCLCISGCQDTDNDADRGILSRALEGECSETLVDDTGHAHFHCHESHEDIHLVDLHSPRRGVAMSPEGAHTLVFRGVEHGEGKQFLDLSGAVKKTRFGRRIDGVSVRRALGLERCGWRWWRCPKMKKVTLRGGHDDEAGIRIKVDSHQAHIDVELADGTTIYAPKSWDGIFRVAEVVTDEVNAEEHFAVHEALLIGAADQRIVLSKPARVSLKGVHGPPHFADDHLGPDWLEIPRCEGSANEQNAGDLSFPGSCYITLPERDETIVWTYHFTGLGTPAVPCSTPIADAGVNPVAPPCQNMAPAAEWPHPAGKWGAGTRNFTIQNRCDKTLWIGLIAEATADLTGDGFPLDQGTTVLYEIPGEWKSGRIWGRTECTFDSSGKGSCLTGDCGGQAKCFVSGSAPATLAEFTLSNSSADVDWYDMSLVDGFNQPLQIAPVPGTNTPDPTDEFSCGCPGCTGDINQCCPTDNSAINSIFGNGLELIENGEVVGCYNGCGAIVDKYGRPDAHDPDALQFCCPECDSRFTGVDTCAIHEDKTTGIIELGKCSDSTKDKNCNECACGGLDSRWSHPTDAVCLWGCSGNCPPICVDDGTGNKAKGKCAATTTSKWFRGKCPSAYSYAYDDLNATFTCPYDTAALSGPDYNLTFCPLNKVSCTCSTVTLAPLENTSVKMVDGSGATIANIAHPATSSIDISLYPIGPYEIATTIQGQASSAPCTINYDDTSTCFELTNRTGCAAVTVNNYSCEIRAGDWNPAFECNCPTWHMTPPPDVEVELTDTAAPPGSQPIVHIPHSSTPASAPFTVPNTAATYDLFFEKYENGVGVASDTCTVNFHTDVNCLNKDNKDLGCVPIVMDWPNCTIQVGMP